jgi:abortive infection bacteriophage resistance protein
LLTDRSAHRQALRAIGYYRLLVFMRRFQNPLTKTFRPRTRFTDIVELYDFDRRLRSITMNALERIEVALRAGLSNPLAIAHGSHWYANQAVYASITGYASALGQIAKECGKRKGLGLTHYHDNYARRDLPPVWLVCEHLTLGALSRLLEALSIRYGKVVGRHSWESVPDVLLLSWLQSLTDLRNACAHHSRLWNMRFVVSQPAIPKSCELSRYGSEMRGATTFYARATIIKALLDPLGYGDEWCDALSQTLASCRHVDAHAHLGFPADWEARHAWA